MVALYRQMLRLYPAEFRRDFGEEMACVFDEAHAAAVRAGVVDRWRFYAREVAGMLGGAVAEQVGSLAGLKLDIRRFAVMSKRNGFRFPVAGIAFMVISLGLVLWAIRNALMISETFANKGYGYVPSHLGFMPSFGVIFALTLVVTVVVCVVRHMMHRSGTQRLEDAQTWPQQ